MEPLDKAINELKKLQAEGFAVELVTIVTSGPQQTYVVTGRKSFE